MNITPGTWVRHEGYPGIWQVAETKTKGGTVYAVLHNPHKALKDGGFEAIAAGPATVEAAADVLQVADKHPRETTRKQPFADQEEILKHGPYWVQSPDIPSEMAPVIFISHGGNMLNEGTGKVAVTELFPPKINNKTGVDLAYSLGRNRAESLRAPLPDLVKNMKPLSISLSNSILAKVPYKSFDEIAEKQIEKALGKEKSDKLISRSNFQRSTLGDLLSLARTIDTIDGLRFSPHSIEEARSLLYMLDDGELIWDKLMLMFATAPVEGILWYERLRWLIDALPETNGKMPLFVRKKYEGLVSRYNEGWLNLLDAKTPHLAQDIGTLRAKKLMRRDAATGLPLYYLWEPEDDVYYLFMPSDPFADLGSRTVAETKADFIVPASAAAPTRANLEARMRVLSRALTRETDPAKTKNLEARLRVLTRALAKMA